MKNFSIIALFIIISSLLIVSWSSSTSLDAQSRMEVRDSLLALANAAEFPSANGVQPSGEMLRVPDVSATQIVFRYADDLWVVAREGGLARPLASPDGAEDFPRFSPDGKRVAFSGNYDGNDDIYVMPVGGGIPQRITYHSSKERLCDWTTEGRLIFSMSGLSSYRIVQLFHVDSEGGMQEKFPVPYGDYGVVSPSGEWLAYTPHNRDFRTWKRYRGGWASDIWLFNLHDHTSKKITDWEGTDTIPMWNNGSIYYLSDAGPNHRLNIWTYDLKSEEHKQATHFREYDVKWPSNGPGPDGKGEIVFENNGRIYLLNLATHSLNPVDITIPGARPTLRSVRKDVKGLSSGWRISPSGKRVLVDARGDVWSLPAKNGSPRNLTRTDGVAERNPSWSPDGKWIVYTSDASGENQLVLHPAIGEGEAETATSFQLGYYSEAIWSPDSNWVVFADHESKFYTFNIETKTTKQFDGVNIVSWGTGAPIKFSWSSDSQWIAYSRPDKNNVHVVMLYNVKTEKTHQVTSGMFWDGLTTFDRKGDFLYFMGMREISEPEGADIGYASVYQNTGVIHALPLRADVANPLKPKSDEEEVKKDKDNKDKDDKDNDEAVKNDDDGDDEKGKEKDGDKDGDQEEDKDKKDNDKKESDEKKKDEDKDKIEPVEIDLENMEARAYRLAIKRGRFGALEVNDKHQLIYQREEDGKNTIQWFDPYDQDKPEEKTVLADASLSDMTPDGTKLLAFHSGKRYIIESKADQKAEDAVTTGPMYADIDPREEWEQIFNDAWRFMRDYFYDPNMHQVDWPAVRKQYKALLADCISRQDVNYVIREMISEVNAGHTYLRAEGDVKSGPSMNIGYLGADFELDQGVYKIAKFYQGGAWDTDARPVTHQLDQNQKAAFTYLFEINGTPLDTSKAPWAAFEGYADSTVTLTVGATPNISEATDVVVKLIDAGVDSNLRYRDWVEHNRGYVDKQSDGKVGYIHVPNTADWGHREIFRQFYGQLNRGALIIDDRWNGGGNIADRYIELLNRPIYLHLFERYENDWRVPGLSHQGPKCMLINPESASGGDIFPYLFRKAGLGKLIGMRTWGGVIGISKNPRFIDGGGITVPFITFYETDGTLTMEGNGVEPDIEVIDDPALMVDGGDPQLDAAIKHMLEEIENNPYVPAKRPPYPNRRGMGILEEDK